MAKVNPKIELDPIFPIPAGTGINRDLKPGQGAEILSNDSINAETGLTYRAFWHIWEQTELVGARMYLRYKAVHPDVANTWLEAVLWCRNVAYRAANFGEGSVEAISETQAQKIRDQIAAKSAKDKRGKSTPVLPSICPQADCSGTEIMKSRRAGVPGFKCRKCNFWWPAEALVGPVEASKKSKTGKDTKKGKKKHEKAKKKGKKAKKKNKKGDRS